MGKAIKQAQEMAAEAAQENTGALPETEGEALDVEAAPAATLEEMEEMDWSQWEADPDDEDAPKPAWRIADDSCADWACRKIAEERAELNRIKELADNQIAAIESKVAATERRYENGTRFLTGKLAEYFGTVPHKETKTQETYRLLSGTLKFKKPKQDMKPDNDALVAYLKASGNADMIKTTEAPKWGEYKKRLKFMGSNVVDETTGEIVESVKVIDTPGTFTVDV
ncbi:MAG: host-nuclease inhibitor Gam family protein [Clostridiales bacterium]|nr:host-nuclease inhibitor Gam family protein [Clostridiales bacterium]MCC8177251.1 host-nuclease inhibitor Gam family protein [Bacteroidales bacterium]